MACIVQLFQEHSKQTAMKVLHPDETVASTKQYLFARMP